MERKELSSCISGYDLYLHGCSVGGIAWRGSGTQRDRHSMFLEVLR